MGLLKLVVSVILLAYITAGKWQLIDINTLAICVSILLAGFIAHKE